MSDDLYCSAETVMNADGNEIIQTIYGDGTERRVITESKGRVKKVLVGTAGTSAQILKYSLDEDGYVDQAEDFVKGEIINYSYDAKGRLQNAACTKGNGAEQWRKETAYENGKVVSENYCKAMLRIFTTVLTENLRYAILMTHGEIISPLTKTIR